MDYGKIQSAYEELQDLDLLEDRREYMAEDLAKGHDLTTEESEFLYNMIQRQFDPKYRDVYSLPDTEAVKFLNTVQEALHQNLDGWNPAEKAVITAFLLDLGVAIGYTDT